MAMEDTALPAGVGDLSPEYQAVVVGGYDEEALLQLVLEASKADEDARFPGIQEALTPTGMVAQHMASLPPPLPLPPYAPLLAVYEGQKVPPLFSVSRRQRRRDHPQGWSSTRRHSPNRRSSLTSSSTTTSSSWRCSF
jgi:hypothetical protein